jgi:hypothetical protein
MHKRRKRKLALCVIYVAHRSLPRVIDLVLQPCFALFDEPEQETEWHLQKGQQAIDCEQFSSFERGVGLLGLGSRNVSGRCEALSAASLGASTVTNLIGIMQLCTTPIAESSLQPLFWLELTFPYPAQRLLIWKEALKVSPSVLARFAHLNVRSVADLLFHFISLIDCSLTLVPVVLAAL